MHATETLILGFLRHASQLQVPNFQRRFSWKACNGQRLFEDTLGAGRDSRTQSHFLDSIVTIAPEPATALARDPLVLIDGQQRIASVMLLLEAVARHASESDVPDGFAPRQLRSYYLQNPHERGDRRHKLVLTEPDQDTFLALIHAPALLPPDPAPLLREQFAYFERTVRKLPPDDLQALCCGIAKLMVVDVQLIRGRDHPQRIFESMNATGLTLTDCDLIRNFLLMDLEPAAQDTLYARYLHPIETDFGRDAYERHFPSLVRAYLALRTGERPKPSALYGAFKDYASSRPVRAAPPDALAADLRRHARYFCAIALGQEPDPVLHRAFARAKQVNLQSAYPLLLKLYEECAAERLTKTDFATIVNLLEAYLVRRAICVLHAGAHVHVFTRLARALDVAAGHAAHLATQILLLSETARFPRDPEFLAALTTIDLYACPCAHHVLGSLENHFRKESLPLRDYSIEHIMPQDRRLPEAWRRELGTESERIQSVWVHRLGNITLTRYNTELGKRPFAEKRAMDGGYRSSPLETLNRDLREAAAWSEQAIDRRGQRLARLALAVWPYPDVPAAALEEARARSRRTRTLADHPQVLPGAPMHDLFELLSRELRALGMLPEPLLHYIAYKHSRANVLDLVPVRQQLRCYLNTDPADLEDPAGLVEDVRTREHWGNGDALVLLRTEAEVPGLVSLVRQVIDAQRAVGEPTPPIHQT